MHRIGFVKGAGAPTEDERKNLTGDPYYTDGLRAVLFFEPRPYSLSELEVLEWEPVPSLKHPRQNVSIVEREEGR
jgi:hypothetical protein